jgi:hypothetical protein
MERQKDSKFTKLQIRGKRVLQFNPEKIEQVEADTICKKFTRLEFYFSTPRVL